MASPSPDRVAECNLPRGEILHSPTDLDTFPYWRLGSDALDCKSTLGKAPDEPSPSIAADVKCSTNRKSEWPAQAVPLQNFDYLLGTYRDTSVPFYFPECRLGMKHARYHPQDHPWPVACQPERQETCLDEEYIEAKDIVTELINCGWFEHATRILLACYESCTSPTTCEGSPDYGYLAKGRCDGIQRHLTRRLKNLDRTIELRKAAIACDDPRNKNRVKAAQEQKAVLVFQFPPPR